MRDLWLKIVHAGGATALSAMSAILGLAITARVLGPSGRGIYAAAVSWVALFAAMGTLSVGQVIVHHVGGRPPSEWLADVVGAALAVTLGAAVVGWLLVGALHLTTHGRLFGEVPVAYLRVAFVALPFLLWADTGRYLLSAMGALSVSNWAQIAGSLVGLATMSALLLGLRLGLTGALVAYVAASMVAGVWTVRHVLRASGRPRFDARLLGRLLLGSAQLHLNAVGSYLFTQGTVLVLNYYRPAAETGQYQLAVQLFALSLIVSGAVSTVGFELVAKRGPDGAWPEQRRLLWQATAIVAGLAGVAYVLAPTVVGAVAGAAFLPAATLFRVLLPALVGATFASVMASQWIGRGLFLQTALLTLAVGCISLACDLVLIPRYGVRGAVVSTLVTYSISVVGNGALAAYIELRGRRAIA